MVVFVIFIFVRSGDVQSESKHFQELLLERTKALAAQAEAALKSNSDGKCMEFETHQTIDPNIYLKEQKKISSRQTEAHSFDAVMYVLYSALFIVYYIE